VIGVNVQRLNEQASAAGSPIRKCKQQPKAALDTIRQDMGMVDDPGLEPLAEILESLGR
jgi:hypothetical protein